VDWMHHLRLVHEARQNIAQEIRDNQQNLAKEMSSLPREEDQLEKLLKVISRRKGGRRRAHGVRHYVPCLTMSCNRSLAQCFRPM